MRTKNLLPVTCKCGRVFEDHRSRVESGRTKYCSKECFFKYRDLSQPRKKYDVSKGNKGWFPKGNIPWSALHPELCKPNKGSIKKGQRISVDTEFKKGVLPHNYKGDSVGYYALHAWVIRIKGSACICEHCNTTNNVEWANKSHEYKRDIHDFIPLCKKCHKKYDKETYGQASRKFKIGKHKLS